MRFVRYSLSAVSRHGFIASWTSLLLVSEMLIWGAKSWDRTLITDFRNPLLSGRSWITAVTVQESKLYGSFSERTIEVTPAPRSGVVGSLVTFSQGVSSIAPDSGTSAAGSSTRGLSGGEDSRGLSSFDSPTAVATIS